jgi:hypothetical protein
LYGTYSREKSIHTDLASPTLKMELSGSTNARNIGEQQVLIMVPDAFPVALSERHKMKLQISRVGQNHIYTVYIRYFWQGNHQIYGHLRCIYTVLANPTD